MPSNSGYHDCPCRDCFEIAVGCDDDNAPDLCSECEDAGCSPDGDEDCQDPHAYDGTCDEDDCPCRDGAPCIENEALRAAEMTTKERDALEVALGDMKRRHPYGWEHTIGVIERFLKRQPDPNPCARIPVYNHTREDGPYNPCPVCLPLMGREALLDLVSDMRATLKYSIEDIEADLARCEKERDQIAADRDAARVERDGLAWRMTDDPARRAADRKSQIVARNHYDEHTDPVTGELLYTPRPAPPRVELSAEERDNCQFCLGAKERDNCQFCLGAKGGTKGNENVIGGVILCDYCTVLARDLLADSGKEGRRGP